MEVLDATNFGTNILFVTVSSKFRFRGSRSNFFSTVGTVPSISCSFQGFSLQIIFKTHKYRGSEQVEPHNAGMGSLEPSPGNQTPSEPFPARLFLCRV
jgi:hypothetical protein